MASSSLKATQVCHTIAQEWNGGLDPIKIGVNAPLVLRRGGFVVLRGAAGFRGGDEGLACCKPLRGNELPIPRKRNAQRWRNGASRF